MKIEGGKSQELLMQSLEEPAEELVSPERIFIELKKAGIKLSHVTLGTSSETTKL